VCSGVWFWRAAPFYLQMPDIFWNGQHCNIAHKLMSIACASRGNDPNTHTPTPTHTHTHTTCWVVCKLGLRQTTTPAKNETGLLWECVLVFCSFACMRFVSRRPRKMHVGDPMVGCPRGGFLACVPEDVFIKMYKKPSGVLDKFPQMCDSASIVWSLLRVVRARVHEAQG